MTGILKSVHLFHDCNWPNYSCWLHFLLISLLLYCRWVHSRNATKNKAGDWEGEEGGTMEGTILWELLWSKVRNWTVFFSHGLSCSTSSQNLELSFFHGTLFFTELLRWSRVSSIWLSWNHRKDLLGHLVNSWSLLDCSLKYIFSTVLSSLALAFVSCSGGCLQGFTPLFPKLILTILEVPSLKVLLAYSSQISYLTFTLSLIVIFDPNMFHSCAEPRRFPLCLDSQAV